MKKKLLIISLVLILVAVIIFVAVVIIRNKPMENPEFTTDINGEQIITVESAKRAAADKANLDLEQITNIKAFLTFDDGRSEYEVEFIYDGYEYEFEIDAKDGSINDYSKERADRDDLRNIDD